LPGDVEIDVRHDYEDAPLDSRDGVTLAVVLGELVTNSPRHAFVGREKGTIWTSLARNKDNVFVLGVSDDGAGLGEGSAQSG
jgi:two-component sensor histidine kinase